MPHLSSMFRRQSQPVSTGAATPPAASSSRPGTPGGADRPLAGTPRQASRLPASAPPTGAQRQASPGAPPSSAPPLTRSATGINPTQARPARRRCLDEGAHKQLD